MNLSEFIQLMYKFIGCDKKRADYVLWLISLVMGAPKDYEEDEADSEGKYNPLSDLGEDMLRKIFRGDRTISPENATVIMRHINEADFTDKIYSLEYSQKEVLSDNLQKYGFEASPENVDVLCTDIFLNLLSALSEGNDHISSDTLKRRDSKGKLITEVPLATAYFENGMLHVGGEMIELPDQLEYTEDTPIEEQPYIKAICEAFSDALGRPVSPADISSLPKRYREEFDDHCSYYNNAAWLQHSVRDVYDDGENQFQILKEDAYEGIKETYYGSYINGHERLRSVLIKITSTTLSKSTLSHIKNLIGNLEKKGICHILVNDGKIVSWVDIDAE